MRIWIWELFYPNLSKVVDSTASSCSCSVSKSCPTLQPHGPQRVRPSYPPPSPRVHPSSYLLNRWHYPTVSSFAALFSFCLQSFPATECFPITWLFVSGGQIIEALASVLPMNIQSWFLLGLTGLISLLSEGLSRVFSSTTVQSINSWALYSL